MSSEQATAAGRLKSAADLAAARLLSGGRAVFVTGLLAALLAWQLSFGVPGTGIDPSWIGGLYMALHDGKNFGGEIVFPYGPLGFLAWPVLWYSWTAAISFLFGGLIYLLFAWTLTWSLGRFLPLLGAGLIAFLFLATIPDLEQLPLLLAVGWGLAALRENRPAASVTVLAVGGGLLGAVETLVKLSVGPPVFVLSVLALAGARSGRREWLLFVTSAAGGTLALWLATGQPLGELGPYAAGGIEVVSGWSEAMATESAAAWKGVALAVTAIVLVAAAARAPFSDIRARGFGVAVVAVAAAVTFKYGIVRFESNHVALAFSAMLGIWLLLPREPRMATPFLVLTVAIGAVAVHTYPNPARLDVIANMRVFGEEAELLARPGRRQQIVDSARAGLQSTYAFDPTTLALLKGKRVDVLPWEAAAVWAYELDWSPLPMFQDLTAFTPGLDRGNAEVVEDASGPQVILRPAPAEDQSVPPAGGFEGRLPAWDPPQENVAIGCNFMPVRTAPPWQVLERTNDRCGSSKLISSLRAEPGEAVPIPRARAGQIVLLRIGGLGVEGFERLRSLLLRPRHRSAIVNGGEATYALIPATGGDGLLVSIDPLLARESAFPPIPKIETLAIEGAEGPLRLDFYQVDVAPLTGAEAPPISAGG